MPDNNAAVERVYDILSSRSRAKKPGIKSSPLLKPARIALHYYRRWRNQSRLASFQKSVSHSHARSIVRDVPGIDGEFEIPVTNNTLARLLGGSYEPSVIALVKASLKPGDHVIDVGANMGFFTVLASQLVEASGRVLAAEPIPTMLKILRSNVTRNHLTNIEIFPGAVSTQAGEITINYVVGAEEYSSLGKISHPDAVAKQIEQIKVPTETLDQLAAKHGIVPALVKVDTEGAEGLVFGGAAKTLEQHRPIILSELDSRLLKAFDSSAAAVVKMLRELNYRVFAEQTGAELTGLTADQEYVGDIVALPKNS